MKFLTCYGVAAVTALSLVSGAGLAAAQTPPPRTGAIQQIVKSWPVTGEGIYLAACATCHGIWGDGRGPGAAGFAQPPTDFTKGTYKFRSTLSQQPAPGDLERSIREGMSGTEMVPYKRILTEKSTALVAAYIRTFAQASQAAQAPGAPVVLPKERPFAVSPESIAAGRKVYEDNCVDCHGEQGQGTPDEQDDWGRPLHMIDFRLGYYKSGNHDTDLYRSIDTGMQGTSMDAYSGDLNARQIWQVVDYIRSLSQQPGGFVSRWWKALFTTRPSGFDYRDY